MFDLKNHNTLVFYGYFHTLQADIALLSKDEIHRLNQISFEPGKQQFSITRSFLRKALSMSLKKPAAEIAFTYNKKGKPEVKGLCFSVSHTKETFVIAISKNTIGIDMEHKERIIDLGKMASFLFSDSELNVFHKIPLELQQAHFLKTWTYKEAYFKAIGTGITSPVKQLEINHHPLKITRTPDLKQNAWYIENIDILPHHYVSLVSNGFINPIEYISCEHLI